MLTVCKSICVSTRLDRSVCQQYRPHDNALDIYPYLFDAINIRQKKISYNNDKSNSDLCCSPDIRVLYTCPDKYIRMYTFSLTYIQFDV